MTVQAAKARERDAKLKEAQKAEKIQAASAKQLEQL